MFRFLITAAVAYAAYRAGEQQAILNQSDYFIINQTTLGSGILATEFVQIIPGGIQLTNDVNLATPFLFREANELKQILRKHNPHFNLTVETTNSSLNLSA